LVCANFILQDFRADVGAGFDTGKPYPPVCTLFFDSVGYGRFLTL
jgi:hypothetical protein